MTLFIKLTSLRDKKPIYINTNHIGHIYSAGPKIDYGRVSEEAHTVVGVTTHNNGGFKVIEDVDKIFKLLKHENIQ